MREKGAVVRVITHMAESRRPPVPEETSNLLAREDVVHENKLAKFIPEILNGLPERLDSLELSPLGKRINWSRMNVDGVSLKVLARD
jgi:hypothetical protein